MSSNTDGGTGREHNDIPTTTVSGKTFHRCLTAHMPFAKPRAALEVKSRRKRQPGL